MTTEIWICPECKRLWHLVPDMLRSDMKGCCWDLRLAAIVEQLGTEHDDEDDDGWWR